jgi:uncharacterized protein (TIGR00369 family)
MEIQTHQSISRPLCGNPIELKEGYSRVELETTMDMTVDTSGLVHGGFIFGQADYAAMIAVNHPHVVLGAAEVKFIKPVKAGEKVIAEAKVTENDGKKRAVEVSVAKEGVPVFEGKFICFVLDYHVLG